MSDPRLAAADDSIEPYYVAKVTRDDPRPVEVNSADGAMPPLPCSFESITPALVTGVLGYVIGAGRRSFSMIFNKQVRGFAGVHKEGFANAKNFAVLSFSYSLPLCILKRIRETDDWKNHTAAGVLSGFVISWGNGPINMLGSSLLLGAISGYLSRSDPTVAHAASMGARSSGSTASGPAHAEQLVSGPGTRQCGAAVPLPQDSPAVAAHGQLHGDLLSSAALLVSRTADDGRPGWLRPRRWQQTLPGAAETVLAALKPGCKSCTISHRPESAVPHRAPASLPGARRQPRGLWASSSSRSECPGASGSHTRDRLHPR